MKNKRNKYRKQEKRIVAILGMIAIICIVGGILTWNYTNKTKELFEKLEGLWIYDSVTSYEFDLENNGILHVSEKEFPFTYKVKGKELHMDFSNEMLEDCVYGISMEGELLYLEGKDGTSGGVYELMKKNI